MAPYTPQWTVINLQGHRNDANENRPGYIVCSSLISVSGQCKSVAFMSSHYWDISSCGIVPGFANPVTNILNFHHCTSLNTIHIVL